MCTLAVFRDLSSYFPLAIAANRDEFLDRPALPPAPLDDSPRFIAEECKGERSKYLSNSSKSSAVNVVSGTGCGCSPCKGESFKSEVVSVVDFKAMLRKTNGSSATFFDWTRTGSNTHKS